MSEAMRIAHEIFLKHILIAKQNGTLFRKTVMDEIKLVLGATQQSAAVRYNEIKKMLEREKDPRIEGLGRSSQQAASAPDPDDDDSDDTTDYDAVWTTFSVKHNQDGTVEILNEYQHLIQGDASEMHDSKVEAHPTKHWVMCKGPAPLNASKLNSPRFINNIIKEYGRPEPLLKARRIETTEFNLILTTIVDGESEDELFTVKAVTLDVAISALKTNFPKGVIREATLEELSEFE